MSKRRNIIKQSNKSHPVNAASAEYFNKLWNAWDSRHNPYGYITIFNERNRESRSFIAWLHEQEITVRKINGEFCLGFQSPEQATWFALTTDFNSLHETRKEFLQTWKDYHHGNSYHLGWRSRMKG